MKPDLYTKIILTVIALVLVLIACNQYVHPSTTAEAQGAFAGVQFAVSSGEPVFFDQRSGEIWRYQYQNGFHPELTGTVQERWRLTKLGQPLIQDTGAKPSQSR